MDPFRLNGFVYPVKKNGVPVRGRWQLWVNLPSEPESSPVMWCKSSRGSRGREKATVGCTIVGTVARTRR